MKNTKTYRSKAAGFVLDNPHTRPDIGMDAIENLFNDTRLEPDDTPSAEAPEKQTRYFRRPVVRKIPPNRGKFFKKR